MNYFLLLEDKENKRTAFYNDKSLLFSNFDKNTNFDSITKPKANIDSSKDLKSCLNDAIYILNRYFFLNSAIIIDENKKIIFWLKRDELKSFLHFYKGVNNEQ